MGALGDLLFRCVSHYFRETVAACCASTLFDRYSHNSLLAMQLATLTGKASLSDTASKVNKFRFRSGPDGNLRANPSLRGTGNFIAKRLEILVAVKFVARGFY